MPKDNECCACLFVILLNSVVNVGHSISNHQEFLKCPWPTPQILLKLKP